MKQYEAVIQVMEKNGGYATLGFLNQHVLKVSDVEWQTKTPFANIRRIVQDKRFFFKIRPGLWALKTFRGKLPVEISPSQKTSKSQIELFNHSYYQGLLVEIGTMNKYDVFIPNQDKNKTFLGKTLKDISSTQLFPQFGYEHLVQKAKTIDVCWFNERKMPHAFFEVEHSTDIQNSLLKYFELQDLHSHFCIVAHEVRRNEYERKLSQGAFKPIRDRVQFLNYEFIADLHSKQAAFQTLNNNFFL